MVELIIAWCVGSYQAGTAVCGNARIDMSNMTEFQCAIQGMPLTAKWSEQNPSLVIQRWTCKFRELPEFAVKGE